MIIFVSSLTETRKQRIMEKVKVGITLGDINGISPEVVLKALSNEKILDYCTPIIYGSSKVLAYHKNIVDLNNLSFQPLSDATGPSESKINVINCWQESANIELGKLTVDGGKHAYIALDRAVRDIEAGHIDVLVTAPINKKAMHLADFPYLGHTEYLGSQFKEATPLMLMVDGDFKLALATTHVPLSEVSPLITKERLHDVLEGLITALKIDFGIERPQIAVLGLNPHAGDDSAIGGEDDEIIKPIIMDYKERGHLVTGPFSADGFFGMRNHMKVDAVLAMYHDQGLIPFKAQSFNSGVNFTAGLPIIRTSPDHGTAYPIAGKNEADPQSMRNAIYLAVDAFRKRKEYKETHENALQPTQKATERK
jgi:4-hydroxythreonine-4-phosphate dehydrogenase